MDLLAGVALQPPLRDFMYSHGSDFRITFRRHLVKSFTVAFAFRHVNLVMQRGTPCQLELVLNALHFRILSR